MAQVFFFLFFFLLMILVTKIPSQLSDLRPEFNVCLLAFLTSLFLRILPLYVPFLNFFYKVRMVDFSSSSSFLFFFSRLFFFSE
jgi:hypothetical protein